MPTAEQLAASLHGILVGSCRRRTELVGDIDILVPLAQWTAQSAQLEGCLPSGVQWQAWAAAPRDYAGLLTYLTGSRQHNEVLRGKAREHGLTFVPWGLFDEAGTQLELESERHLFDMLGVDWKEPEQR